MPAGEFIRKVRRQRKMTQQDLAVHIMNRTTLGKFEKGKINLSIESLTRLFERLGYGANLMIGDEQEKKNEIKACLLRQDCDEVMRRVAALENDDFFIAYDYNRQFVCFAKAAVAIIKNENPGRVLPLVERGIALTIPDFIIKKVENYLLNGNELDLINQLTIVYERSGKRDEAIHLMTALVKNFDKNFTDLRYKGQYYPLLIYNLTKYLHETGAYKEAMALCEKGVAVCNETGYLMMMPQILTNKARCLLDMNKKNESLALLRQAFHLFCAFGQDLLAGSTNAFVKEHWGTGLPPL
jgi:transcriptional regulator with XRE-family HTH domain